MRNKFALLMLFPMILFSSASHSAISQQRAPDETFQQALNRAETDRADQMIFIRDTPIKRKTVISEINFSMAPEVSTFDELIQMFYLIRDSRFLYSKNNPDFSRRISWLYPDDGCFARASLSGMKLDDKKLIRPMKIFAFGDLAIETPYSPSGSVSWWYHVAGVVRFMGANYVLDPALNPYTPLLVEDWFIQMGNTESLTGVVCNSFTYDPFDDCFKATKKSDQHAQRDQLIYLNKEWNRLASLGLDPVILLGTNPPWIPEYSIYYQQSLPEAL